MRTRRPLQALDSTGGCGGCGRRRQPPPPGVSPGMPAELGALSASPPARGDAAFRGPSGVASAPIGGRGRTREGRPDVVALPGGSPRASLRGWGFSLPKPHGGPSGSAALSPVAGRHTGWQGHRAEASGTLSQLARGAQPCRGARQKGRQGGEPPLGTRPPRISLRSQCVL